MQTVFKPNCAALIAPAVGCIGKAASTVEHIFCTVYDTATSCSSLEHSRLSELKNHESIELTIYHLEESNFAGPPV